MANKYNQMVIGNRIKQINQEKDVSEFNYQNWLPKIENRPNNLNSINLVTNQRLIVFDFECIAFNFF